MIHSIQIIKQIDRILGPVLLKIFPRALKKKKRSPHPNKILIIRPGGMGDAILLIPVLKAVSKKIKPANIDILCEPRNQEIFHAVQFVNNTLSYKNPTDLISVFRKQYDIIIDTEQSHFLTAIITRLLKADLKSGFHVNGRQKMYTISIPYRHDIYEADSFWNLIAKTLDFKESFSWDFPYFKQEKKNFISDICFEKYICVFPGASIDERLWPEKSWAKVIDQLTQFGWKCVLLGSHKEINQCRTIIKYCKTRDIINLCSQLTILETTLVLKKSSLLISTDSGILHLGVLSDVSTVSLFGPGIEAKWAPKGHNHLVINKNLDCSPCTKFGTTPPCGNFKLCMLKITPMDVINKAKKLITLNE
ncbi:glycosyltransferase family 9 protein [Desulfobacula toluolica]|uniref:Glycosyl transferase, family 9 n=1 Tax=Desulfobacula toluolica (strain DSM 7467 / Tol2) TaxID=651182 RepID=K0NK64_DESTT|nr:glycosyltransferase family 9 protein [Desulfobacula toluolica]CCK80298.1 glycosyl transferase, family 9 [Desulfobacula toluolica Tol2]